MASRMPPGSSGTYYRGTPQPITYQQVPTTPAAGGFVSPPPFPQPNVPPPRGHYRAMSHSTSAGSSAEIYGQQPMTHATSLGVQTGQIGGGFGPYAVCILLLLQIKADSTLFCILYRYL